jgi:hypothetical protein
LLIVIMMPSALLLAVAVLAGAFAEENLPFVDPYTGEVITDTAVSSIHFDLAYALSVCAGFTITDAKRIQLVSQLVDTQEVGDHSLCTGSLPETPASRDVCRVPLNTVWPMSDQVEGPGCFTSRFGAFSPLFHYARDNPSELGAVRAWAYGRAMTLTGYAAFAYGGTEVVDARCVYTQPMPIDTGTIRANSLDAFAIYLHALGDSWSHRDCVNTLDAAGKPWGTHTNEYYDCNATAHRREFGPSDSDTDRAEAGVRAIYQELKERSRAREGQYLPVEESANGGWLDSQLEAFIHNWDHGEAEERRVLAATIADTCQVIQSGDPAYQRIPRRYLPIVLTAPQLTVRSLPWTAGRPG